MLHSTKYHPIFDLSKRKMKASRNIIALISLLVLSGNPARSQAQTTADTLFTKIAQLDSVVFGAFNKRDTATFNSYFSKDLEFFHDKGGLTGYAQTAGFLKQVASQPGNDLRRELVKGSMEVYPIPGYGAIQTGSHTFCHTENNKQDCGTFKFVQIWQLKDGQWKVTRVVSYDH